MLRVIVCFLTVSFGIFIHASDFDGKWGGTMQGPEGEMQLVFNFKVVNGDSLTGTSLGPTGDLEILNGKVDGGNFSFDVDIYGMTIHHDCTVVNETIEMVVPGMDGEDVKIILARLEEEEE